MGCAGCFTLNWDIPRSAEMWSDREGSWDGGSREEFVKDSALRRNFPLPLRDSIWTCNEGGFSQINDNFSEP